MVASTLAPTSPSRWRARRRPAPRHALQPPARRPARRGDGSALGVFAVLLITSGFVAGTTATFSGTTSNAGNTFASAALSGPSGLQVTPTGSTAVVAWTDAVGYDNASTGYRVSVADWQAAPSSVPTTCGTGSGYSKVGVAGTTSFTDSTLGSAPHTNFVDGRLWCYKAETVYPYPENTSPWISQVGNPTTVFEAGHTLVSAVFAGDGDFQLEGGTAAVDGPDWFELTFNQAVDPSDYPSGYVCTDNGSDRILVGVDSSTGSANCPKTGGGADTRLSGFWLSGGTVSTTSRFAIGTVTSVGCPGTAPPGCFRLRIHLRQRTAGSNPTVSGTYIARGTANTSYLGTVGATRSFCQSGAATTVTGLATTFKYRANPSGGNCQATVAGNF